MPTLAAVVAALIRKLWPVKSPGTLQGESKDLIIWDRSSLVRGERSWNINRGSYCSPWRCKYLNRASTRHKGELLRPNMTIQDSLNGSAFDTLILSLTKLGKGMESTDTLDICKLLVALRFRVIRLVLEIQKIPCKKLLKAYSGQNSYNLT